jgi:hypothetical protein
MIAHPIDQRTVANQNFRRADTSDYLVEKLGLIATSIARLVGVDLKRRKSKYWGLT